jgi:hypothetical protein
VRGVRHGSAKPWTDEGIEAALRGELPRGHAEDHGRDRMFPDGCERDATALREHVLAQAVRHPSTACAVRERAVLLEQAREACIGHGALECPGVHVDGSPRAPGNLTATGIAPA